MVKLNSTLIGSQRRTNGPVVTMRTFLIPSVDDSSTSPTYEFQAPAFGSLFQFKIVVPDSTVNVSVGTTPDFQVGTNEEVLRVVNVTGYYDETDIDAFYTSPPSSPLQSMSSLWIFVENIGQVPTGDMTVEFLVRDY